MEGDLPSPFAAWEPVPFQSTPSAWRETYQVLVLFCRQFHFNPLPPHGGRQLIVFVLLSGIVISIHSLRMEGDPVLGKFALSDRHFNPLPPHGGRHITPLLYLSALIFQSTPSAWRETCGVIRWGYRKNISIHSLRMEGDL